CTAKEKYRLAGGTVNLRATLFPEVGAVLGHDVAVLDQQTTPGDDAPVLQIIVSDDGELGLFIALHVLIRNLPRLDEGAQFFLPVLEAHGHIRRALYPPEEIHVVAKTLVPFGIRNRA